MDYQKIMAEQNFTFRDFYEQMIEKIVKEFPEELKVLLKEKRNFGYTKYGSHSFQGNFENAMTSPVKEHALEELIDACNYLAHCVFQSIEKNEDEDGYKKALSKAASLYQEILHIK